MLITHIVEQQRECEMGNRLIGTFHEISIWLMVIIFEKGQTSFWAQKLGHLYNFSLNLCSLNMVQGKWEKRLV